MRLNTVLAIVIILIFLLAFIYWISIVAASLVDDPFLSTSIFVPGFAFFGFWGLISYQLYNSN